MIRDTTKRKVGILIIDDDEDVCQYLKQFLEEQNFDVDFITDSQKAVSTIKGNSYQIVILDIVMPKVDGIELLQNIKKEDDDLCVIMLSGYPTFERARETFKHDCFDFLTKPFEKETLLETIKGAIKEYGLVTDLNQKATHLIAQRVHDLRMEKKLSLRQLANRTGLSPSLIYQVEHAQTTPSVATISRIAAALNSEMEYFFKGV
ncbi:MAG: response regulator [candidate division Zixibacteria bacterium]|nr:response regulator [candidate division Zixibacteria bacterium]